MKKLLFTALIAVSLISSSFVAPSTKINYRVKSSFEATFGSVKDIEWASTNSYVTATFVLNDKKVQAYFDTNGSYIGTTEAVSLSELPVKAKRKFAEKYANFTVKEAIKFEKANETETAYYISAQNEKENVIIKVLDGQLSVFNK